MKLDSSFVHYWIEVISPEYREFVVVELVAFYVSVINLQDLSFMDALRYVAFARDAGNIAQGAKNGARVIYGDGCKFVGYKCYQCKV